MAIKPEVAVIGLRELSKELRRLDPKWSKALRESNKRAAEIVAAEARVLGAQSRTNLAGRPTRFGSRGVASIKPRAGRLRAEVVMGRNLPYARGHEWGSSRWRQFASTNREGYILRPALKAREEEAVNVFTDGMEEVWRAAFPG